MSETVICSWPLRSLSTLKCKCGGGGGRDFCFPDVAFEGVLTAFFSFPATLLMAVFRPLPGVLLSWPDHGRSTLDRYLVINVPTSFAPSIGYFPSKSTCA